MAGHGAPKTCKCKQDVTARSDSSRHPATTRVSHPNGLHSQFTLSHLENPLKGSQRQLEAEWIGGVALLGSASRRKLRSLSSCCALNPGRWSWVMTLGQRLTSCQLPGALPSIWSGS